MKKFISYISEKWNLSKETTDTVCSHYDVGDSVHYVSDYEPGVSSDISLNTLAAIYADLDELNSLSTKKKRIINALKKDNKLTVEIETTVQNSVSSVELDDMLLKIRQNPRSKAQMAIKKGLKSLADLALKQEIETGTVEELAEKYVGEDSSLKDVDDVLNGVIDILAETLSHDTTVREMLREVGYEDGFFEVLPKNKKDKKFAIYRGKYLPVTELTAEEYIQLVTYEKNKNIRFKYGVQLFQISELMREHFIENPDSIFFDILSEAIDECWSRFLSNVVEKFVKDKLNKMAINWATQEIEKDLAQKETNSSKTIMTAYQPTKNKLLIASVQDGRLLGLKEEKLNGSGKPFSSSKIRQLYTQGKHSEVVVISGEFSEIATSIFKKTFDSINVQVDIKSFSSSKISKLASSKWIENGNSFLTDDMKKAYATGIIYLKPLSLIPEIGLEYFDLHPLQNFVPEDLMMNIIKLRAVENELGSGILPVDAPDSVLKYFPAINDTVLVEIQRANRAKKFKKKSELLSVKGVDEVVFRNIAGYIVIPDSENPLDKTLVHPNFYEWVEDLVSETGTSIEVLLENPQQLLSVHREDEREQLYIENKLPKQLSVYSKYKPVQHISTRRSRLSELKVDSVVKGKITKITNFGAFVDINAVSEGLVHISQLADTYVESPEQVVKVNQVVNVKILDVDKKKRKISLSMKNLGNKAPKVKPSQNQLFSLASHFNKM